jgi:hypothetical protein
MDCNDCAMENILQPCEACTCPIHGILLKPRPDPATRGKTIIWVCPICSKNKR